MLSSDKKTARNKKIDRVLLRGWLADCAPDLQKIIISRTRLKSFPKGTEVYRAGDKGDGIYGLAQGAISLEFPSDTGEAVIVHQSEPGYWIGDLAILSNTPRLVTIKTTQDSTFLVLSAKAVQNIIEQNMDFLQDFYRLSYDNLHLALRLIASLTQRSADKAVALRLFISAETTGFDNWINITQSELANLSGVSDASVKRIVSKFVAEGILITAYGKFMVADPQALKTFCQT